MATMFIAAVFLMILHSAVTSTDEGSSRLPSRFWATKGISAAAQRDSHIRKQRDDFFGSAKVKAGTAAGTGGGSVSETTQTGGGAGSATTTTTTSQTTSSTVQQPSQPQQETPVSSTTSTTLSAAPTTAQHHHNHATDNTVSASFGLNSDGTSIVDMSVPSSLIPSPQWSDIEKRKRHLAHQCTLPAAWKLQYWFSNRSDSVVQQHAVRDTLLLEGQYWISRLAVKKQEQARPCKRTVVSIATIPTRIGRLYNLIHAIRRQELPPDQILIAIPPFAPRLKQTFDDDVIPSFLKDDPMVKLVHIPVDFGPLSKVAAAIYSEQDPDTCIITVDDDNEPRPHLFRLMSTWASLFPTAVIGESGWNVTCITNKVPFVCGEGYDAYLFVRQVSCWCCCCCSSSWSCRWCPLFAFPRSLLPSSLPFVVVLVFINAKMQDWDTLCQPENLPLYNFHECLGPVDSINVRPADVVMGVSNPLYRRGMFDDSFLDIAKIVAKRKIRKMISSHYKALELEKEVEQARAQAKAGGGGAAAAAEAAPKAEKTKDAEKEELEHLTEDQAQLVRIRAMDRARNSVVAREWKQEQQEAMDAAERKKQALMGKPSPTTDENGHPNKHEAKDEEAESKRQSDILSPRLLELAHAALQHPDLEETDHLLRWKRVNPPDALFLVDDVYISAYLGCKGIPRLIAPATPHAKPPVPMLQPKAEKDFPPQPPRPANEGPPVDLAAVNALHGEARFNQGNHEAVRFFHQEGCW